MNALATPLCHPSRRRESATTKGHLIMSSLTARSSAWASAHAKRAAPTFALPASAATIQLAAKLVRLHNQVSSLAYENMHPAYELDVSHPLSLDDCQALNALAAIATDLTNELYESAGSEAFFYEYQPISDIRTREVKGHEALLRWTRRGQTVLPASFLPIADETGSLVLIQQCLLDSIAALQQTLPNNTSIAINWSPSQLSHPRAVSAFIDRVHELQLDSTQLVVEITEHTLTINPDAAYSNIRRLKEQGFQIALDDFGRGYCGLSYLRHLPVDCIKLDRSLIQDMGTSPRASLIAAAIIDFAHMLGTTVVAEGVETECQLSSLRHAGCDFAQGYLIGRPSRLVSPTS
jgi:EAL domain-containing protein (putative c-di-GMP-specific phosphodiesterase class I)